MLHALLVRYPNQMWTCAETSFELDRLKDLIDHSDFKGMERMIESGEPDDIEEELKQLNKQARKAVAKKAKNATH